MLFSIQVWEEALLVMLGQRTRSESLFYYFRIEDHIPEDHLLRLIDRHIDFGFVRETLKASYSHTGRPSIDPEVLLRILLIGYCTESPVNAVWSRTSGCIWLIDGLLGWASTKMFRITRHSPRIGTAVFGSRRSSSISSSESSSNA